MIAVDLDGTLLDGGGRISDANLEAIIAAQSAGMLVVPSTGRSWRESRQVLASFPLPDGSQPGVFVSGAAISDLATGKTHDMSVIEPNLAMQIVKRMRDLPEAVLVFRDAELAGHDYMVTGQGVLTANTQWWFQETGASVRFVDKPTLDDMHHTLRVGIVATAEQTRQVGRWIAQTMGESIIVQSFEVVQQPDARQSVHVLEIFAQGVDKWRGLDWIARQHDIDPNCVAMIGDAVNDLAAIRAAGCGIAMGNADDQIKAAADHVTARCDDDGAAHAINQLLAGNW